MYNITLIGTHHSEIGKCNSDELYKIIESITPDVIFEELSALTFDIVYKKIIQHPDEPLETKSIKRYFFLAECTLNFQADVSLIALSVSRGLGVFLPS